MSDLNSFGLHLSLVSADPIIVYVSSDNLIQKRLDDGSTPLQRMTELFDGPVCFIVSPWWFMPEREQFWQGLSASLQEARHAKPGTRIIVACNDPSEVPFASGLGFEALLCNQNGFVQDYFYKPRHDAEKVFDAIYNARMVKWKRHSLCRDIARLAFLYSPWGEGGEAYRLKLAQEMPSATFINGPAIKGQHRQLHGDELRHAYTSAKVGLCLSASEGAMFSSIEYLLCGLPVVTTASTGGRREMFDDAFCRTVEADAHAVATATRDLIALDIDPDTIRAKTMEKVIATRHLFEALIAGIQKDAGKPVTAARDLARLLRTWSGMTYTTLAQLKQTHDQMLAAAQ